jgi:hypothetical protein
MQVVRVTPRYWKVLDAANAPLAQFILDRHHQMSEVICRTSDLLVQRRIKELALNHALQYQRTRNIQLPGARACNPGLSSVDSIHLMSFEAIPRELTEYNDARLNNDLARFPVRCTLAAFDNWIVAVNAAMTEIANSHGVVLDCMTARADHPDTDMLAAFHIKSDHVFRVWKALSNASSVFYITPSYHPRLQNAHSVGLINSGTDSLIGENDNGICRVTSPAQARTSPSVFGTWQYLNHPYYAEGNNLGVQLSIIRILSQDGYDLLVRLLRGALNVNNLYLEVISGFFSPYAYPQKPQDKVVRGTEHDVVWQYRTLEKEGKLEGSVIPDWFMGEKWLEVYPEEI